MLDEQTLFYAIKGELSSLDAELQNASLDIWYEPNFNTLYVVGRGEAYVGDDTEACEVAHVDEQVIVID